MVTQPTVISTFAGCGGSSLGYKLAGFRELLAVEWDDNAVETFRLNFPSVPVYHGDIGKLTGAECMKLAGVKVGELDVFDGSPPCQGFSTAGKRKFDDPRNSLFKEFARLLVELQPKVFVMENVTGMVKGCMKQAYLTIIATLRDCGYVCKGEVLNAMYFNVPQSRERVIIIGVRKDLGIQPSHPKPQTRPIAAGKAIEGVENKTFNRPLAKVATAIWNKTRPGQNGTVLRAGYYMNTVKVDPTKPAPTIPKVCSGTGSTLHWKESRTLTIEEAKRVASFPDEFRLNGKFVDQWARIGNSVPPNLMRAIAEHIRTEILDKVQP
jgi:DNA (cytosine-5)-methyltransferase 1